MRTGRPTNNPKKYRVDIRLTEDEMIMLNECMARFQMNKTEVLLKGMKDMYSMLERENNEKE